MKITIMVLHNNSKNNNSLTDMCPFSYEKKHFGDRLIEFFLAQNAV